MDGLGDAEQVQERQRRFRVGSLIPGEGKHRFTRINTDLGDTEQVQERQQMIKASSRGLGQVAEV